MMHQGAVTGVILAKLHLPALAAMVGTIIDWSGEHLGG
jgi:hypothetical protein